MAQIVGELILRALSAATGSYTGATTSAATLNRPTGAPNGNIGLQMGGTFVLDCTTSAGTNRRMFVEILGQFDAGDTLFRLEGVRFGAITSTGAQSIYYPGVLPPNLFVSTTINGTGSPSFTHAVKCYALG
mgnify:CR=1 FL=1